MARREPPLLVATLIALAFAGLNGCTADPALSQYPIRHIDRPYTLPDNVGSWTTYGVAAVTVNGSNVRLQGIPFPIPLGWEYAISDTWTLDGIGIPLGIRHQIHHDEIDTVGVRLALNQFGFSTAGTVIVGVGLSGYYRHLFTDDLALETSLAFNPAYAFGEDGNGFGGNITLGLSPVIQLSDTWALAPTARLILGKGTGISLFGNLVESSYYVHAPVGLNASWLFHRQWQIKLDYTFVSARDFQRQSHGFLLALTHYW